MKKAICLFGIAVVSLCTSAIAAPTSYSGSLSRTNGSLIVGGQIWTNSLLTATTLSWVVTDMGSGEWHYQYTFTVPGGNIGCVILEASPTFAKNNMSSVTTDPPDWINGYCVGTHQAADNPNMPADMYGIRFCSLVDPTTLVIGFDSDRDPVWGDFYASGYFSVTPAGDGLLPNYAYNAGFMTPDPLLVGPHNGSEQYHLLVPDTTSTVPVPGAIALCGLGTVLVARLRRGRLL